ncbi:hypothetical protein [Actinoplanes sp. NPDC026670]|uniref:hypothetical protein n=1 Tax=Actinoplanes sp. NPDC026670 TaxID=3154700 RepID=UPI0033F51D3D
MTILIRTVDRPPEFDRRSIHVDDQWHFPEFQKVHEIDSPGPADAASGAASGVGGFMP